MIEEMLISPVIPVMSIYRLAYGQNLSRGHVVNFSQDICSLITILPKIPSTIPLFY